MSVQRTRHVQAARALRSLEQEALAAAKRQAWNRELIELDAKAQSAAALYREARAAAEHIVALIRESAGKGKADAHPGR